MKFKSADKEYKDIETARADYCIKRGVNCRNCPISVRRNRTSFGCRMFAKTHTQKAAALMGLEIEEVNDEEI